MSKNKNRSTKEETYDLIEKDLDYAASVLPKEWGAENRGRITKGAAFAFKSRAMLYAERWDKVKASADSVFNLQMYSLTDAYGDAWKGGNSEAILEYEYLRTGPSHGFDKSYAPFGEIENGGGSGTPTQEMVESYEKADGTQVDWSPWHVADGTTVRPPYEELEPRFRLRLSITDANGKAIRWKIASAERREDSWSTVTTLIVREKRQRGIICGS